jgi:hypothetical protein
MIQKLLFKHQSKKQLYIAALGTLVGFVFLLSSVHYFFKIKEMDGKSDLLQENTLILQKKVSKFNALGLNSTFFSKDEIADIKALPFIHKVAPIFNNKFKISLGMHQEGLPYFRTDIFVQSVNKNLLDAKPKNWTWKDTSTFIPLIMPRDFMVMLNQFAAAYKMPQVSEDLAKTIVFQIEISHEKEKQVFQAKVVDFSNQISAVLVPLEWMDYANKNFTDDTLNQEISQLIVAVKPGHFADFQSLMDNKNLETKQSDLLITKIKSILEAGIGLILSIGVLIVLLSTFIILQYTQLLISKSNYEIGVLLRLGYHPQQIAYAYSKYSAQLFGSLFLMSTGLFFIVQHFMDSFMGKSGLFFSKFPSITAFGLLFVTAILIVAANHLQAKKIIFKKMKIVK